MIDLELINKDLDKIAALPSGWDQMGAPKINPKIVESARWLANSMGDLFPFQPRVVPMSRGRLQFEFGNGEFALGKGEWCLLELELESPEVIHYLLIADDGDRTDAEEESISLFNRQEIARLCERFNEAVKYQSLHRERRASQ